MRLEQLQYLKITANCHSMRNASEILHVSQQNISKAICNLEEELNMQLFERTPSGVFLTKDGEKVYLLACEVCDRTEKISRLSQLTERTSQCKNLKGTFMVTTIPGYSSFLTHAFLQIKDIVPQISFWLEEREALEVVQCLLEYQLEFALTTLDNEFQFITDERFWKNYDILILHQDYLKVLTTLSSPLLQYQSISDKQIAQYPLITYSTGHTSKPLIQQLLDAAGILYKNLICSNSFNIYGETIIQQKAISISSDLVFKSAARNNLDNFVLLPMTHKIPIVHVYIRKKKLSPFGQLFEEQLLKQFLEVGIIPQPTTPC